MNGSVQIVVQITQVFKNRCLIVRLGKLVVHIEKLNAFGIAPAAQMADTVRVHGLIGNRVLRRMGLAVALILADDRLNFSFFRAGEFTLCRCVFRCGFCRLGQSLLPPFPFDIAAQGRRMRYRSDRGAPLDG